MEQSAYIMEAIAGVIILVVGSRLYWLSRQTGQAPEYFIALAFLIWALGYALYDIPYAFAEGDQSIAPFFAYTSMLVFNLGNVALALFTREVFRKQQRWAGWLVVAIAVCLALGAAGSAWVGDWEQVDPFANPGYWPQTVGGLIPAIWMGVEGLAHYARARKRLKIGLCAPLTCHHFLLWGLAGALLRAGRLPLLDRWCGTRLADESFGFACGVARPTGPRSWPANPLALLAAARGSGSALSTRPPARCTEYRVAGELLKSVLGIPDPHLRPASIFPRDADRTAGSGGPWKNTRSSWSLSRARSSSAWGSASTG